MNVEFISNLITFTLNWYWTPLNIGTRRIHGYANDCSATHLTNDDDNNSHEPDIPTRVDFHFYLFFQTS